MQLMSAAFPPDRGRAVALRVRYFDAERGLPAPAGVASLVDHMSATRWGATRTWTPCTGSTLLCSRAPSRAHDRQRRIDGERHRRSATRHARGLEPGAGARLLLRVGRFVQQPTVASRGPRDPAGGGRLTVVADRAPVP